MPFPTEAELFPSGDLAPVTAKEKFRQWLLTTRTLLGTTGTAADARTALGAAADVQATESVRGTAEVATQTETNAGTDDLRIVTPKKLRAGFLSSFATNGYIALPSWLGGFILQWGTSGIITGAGGSATITLPIAYPTANRGVFITPIGAPGGGSTPSWVGSVTLNNFSLTNQSNVAQTFYWLSVGN